MAEAEHRPSKRWSLAIYEKEVQDMEQDKIHTAKVTKESVESTRRMLQLVNECEDAGVNTLRMLHTQGEALNRTEGTLDEMDNDLADSAKTVKRISVMNKVPLVLLPIYLMFKSKPPPIPQTGETQSAPAVQSSKKTSSSKLISKPRWFGGKGKITEDDNSSNNKNDNLNLNHGRRSILDKDLTENTDRFFMRITGDEEEDEIENNLGAVSKHLHALKGQAIHLGTTVQDQNVQLGRIQTKAEDNEAKIGAVTGKTKKLVGSNDSGDAISTSSCLSCLIS